MRINVAFMSMAIWEFGVFFKIVKSVGRSGGKKSARRYHMGIWLPGMGKNLQEPIRRCTLGIKEFSGGLCRIGNLFFHCVVFFPNLTN